LGTYDVAQICENGHVITTSLRSSPEFGRKFCEKCGAPTLDACRECSAPILGYYDVPGVISIGRHYDRPNFCRECGAPYPWMRSARDEWKSLAELVQGLTNHEREQLAAAVDDLVIDTPRTDGAVARVKLLAPKLGAEVWGAMKAILINVGTEAAKKGLGL
jgi:hypothetical protein